MSSEDNRLVLNQPTTQSTFGQSTFVHNEQMLQQLIQMGFDPELSKQSLLATGNRSVDAAISHLTDPSSSAPATNTPTPANIITPTTTIEDQSSTTTTAALFSSANQVKRTADVLSSARRGLKGDSLENKLEFEQRQRQVEAERMAKERREEKLRLQQLRLREREERESRIREQEERRRRFEQNLVSRNTVQTNKYDISDVVSGGPAAVTTTTASVPTSSASTGGSSSSSGAKRDCAIQVRLPDGSSLTTTLQSDCTLHDLYMFVHGAAPEFSREQFSLISPFPRREYNPQDLDLSTVSLSQAGLVPRGSMIVQQLKSRGVVTRGESDATTAATTTPDTDDTHGGDEDDDMTGGGDNEESAFQGEARSLGDTTSHLELLVMNGPWLQVSEEEAELNSIQNALPQATATVNYHPISIFRPKSWVDQNCDTRRRTAINFMGQSLVSESRIDPSNGVMTSLTGAFKLRMGYRDRRTEMSLAMNGEAARTYTILSLTSEVLVLGTSPK